MLELADFILWLDQHQDAIARITCRLMAKYHWTPRQIAEDVTIEQLMGLWDFDEVDDEVDDIPSRWTQSSGDQLLKSKVKELTPGPPLKWRHNGSETTTSAQSNATPIWSGTSR